MYNLKKYTKKDRYGNSITIELDTMQQPTVPSMDTIPHPGQPKGTDTVPAWLTPGEFVMNAEATRMYEPQIKAMNEHGRAIQRQQGGTIPELPEGIDRYVLETTGQGTSNAKGQRIVYEAKGSKEKVDTSWVTPEILDGLKFSESSNRHYDKDGNLLTSKAGAVGAYQFIPKYATKGMGYGVAPFDVTSEAAQREAAGQYLRGMQKHYPDWDPTDVLRAYNWGPKNVADLKEGWLTQYDMPDEARNYPGKVITNAIKKPWINRAEGSTEPEFFQRIMRPEEYPFITNDDGSISTHRMAAEVDPEGNWQVFPTIQMQEDGTLKEYEDPQEARAAAVASNNFIPMPDKETALSYAKSYKKGTPLASFDPVPRIDNIPDIVQKELSSRKKDPEIIYDDQIMTAEDLVKIEKGREKRKDRYVKELADQVEEGKAITPIQEQTLERLAPKEYKKPVPLIEEENIPEVFDQGDAAKLDTWDNANERGYETLMPDSQFEIMKRDVMNAYDGSFVQDVVNWFGDMFKSQINNPAVQRAAFQYLGSRLMGYNHNDSANWAAKNFNEESKAQQKLERDLYLKGTYTPESIKEAVSTGDFGKLSLKAKPLNLDSKIKYATVNGQRIPVQFDQSSNRHVYIDKTGAARVIPNEYIDEDGDKGYKTWNDVNSAFSKRLTGIVGSKLKERLDKNGIIVPSEQALADNAASAFEAMGYDPNNERQLKNMMTIVNRAKVRYGEKLRKDPDEDPGSFEAFLRDEIYLDKMGRDSNLFLRNPEATKLSDMEYVSERKMTLLFNALSDAASTALNEQGKENPSAKDIQKQVDVWLSKAAKYYKDDKNGLGLVKRKSFEAQADSADTTGFYAYMATILKDREITPEEIGG